MTQNSIADNRMVWLDVVRCVAMLMVIGVHCIDPFYISPTMRVIPEYTHWAAIYGSPVSYTHLTLPTNSLV